jgi:hypothetical protein
VAPEFQLTNELTEVNFSTILEDQVYSYVDSAGDQFSGADNSVDFGATSGQNVVLHTAEFEPFASDLGTLLDQLGLVFMEGAMPSTMKATLLTYLQAAPPPSTGGGGTQGGNAVNKITNASAAAAALKVIDATSVIVNSAQYAIQN